MGLGRGPARLAEPLPELDVGPLEADLQAVLVDGQAGGRETGGQAGDVDPYLIQRAGEQVDDVPGDLRVPEHDLAEAEPDGTVDDDRLDQRVEPEPRDLDAELEEAVGGVEPQRVARQPHRLGHGRPEGGDRDAGVDLDVLRRVGLRGRDPAHRDAHVLQLTALDDQRGGQTAHLGEAPGGHLGEEREAVDLDLRALREVGPPAGLGEQPVLGAGDEEPVDDDEPGPEEDEEHEEHGGEATHGPTVRPRAAGPGRRAGRAGPPYGGPMATERPGAEEWVPSEGDLPALRSAAPGCRGCELWADATQVVFSAGEAGARLMLVGEQPGDREDREGEPFVGPAGRVLADALDAAGIARDEVYLTNAVKHFRFTERGKRRIHKKPGVAHVEACHPWLAAERAAVRPAVVVCLGATAARAVLGRDVRIGEVRGEVLDEAGGRVLVTTHPSALLRLRGKGGWDAAFAELTEDLRTAHRVAAR